MKQTIVDQKYHLISMFNPKTGAYVCTGIINELSLDISKDPFMASFPRLISARAGLQTVRGKRPKDSETMCRLINLGITARALTGHSKINSIL